MPTSSYMPTDDSGKADLLDHIALTVLKYLILLEISDADLAVRQADAVAFRYALRTTDNMQSNGQHWTAHKNLLRDGGTGSGEWPVAPTLEQPVPPAVPPGIIPRLWTFVAHVKTHKNYTTAIGQDLWVVGASHIVDPSTWKPVLGVQIQAGHPVIAWTKGKAGAIEIWVDRNDGNNFVFLTINTEPNTTDPSPLPAPGTSAAWRYKAIYRLHDEQVGQWSDVMSIAVGG
jgi:hypothetical protein